MASGQFGKCAKYANQPFDFDQLWTMLHIKDVQYLSDARSIVEAVKGKRFQVIRCRVANGYCKASVEWIVDESLATIPIEKQSAFVEQHNCVRRDALAWIQSKSTMEEHIDIVYSSIT